jgi:Leucine-rich repeat (LRR) protein
LGLEDNAISSWQEVLRLAGLPNLQRLSLSGNPISSITYPAGTISPGALFSSNHLQDGIDTQQGDAAAAEAAAAAAAEAAAGGCVAQIAEQHEQELQNAQQQPFCNLQALLLGDCSISSWADIDQLNRFPALCELRLSGNPLFSTEASGGEAGRATSASVFVSGAGRRFEVRGVGRRVSSHALDCCTRL